MIRGAVPILESSPEQANWCPQQQQLAQFSSGHLEEVQVASTDLDTMKRSNPNAAVITTVPTYGRNLYFKLGDPS